MNPLPIPCQIDGPELPAYSHPGDAGADLKSSEDDVLPARGRKLVATGLRVAIPAGHVGLIWPRSGLAVKQGIDCGAGVIDAQYRGEIKVLLFNHSDQDVPIQKGDRIAQLLIQKVETARFERVDDLDATDRGDGGFGSTGQ